MAVSAALAAAVTGLLFGLSLIIAVGPQNSFVIRQGLRREYVGVVVTICAISDVLLIAAGVGGMGAALAGRAWLVRVIGVLGVAFLVAYGAVAARRAARPPRQPDDLKPAPPEGRGWRGAAAACLAFTWLNPGVYVDTVVLVGPVAHSHGRAAWWFGAGAGLGSVLWFVALGFGARALAPLLAGPGAQRVIDASVAVIMFATALRVAVGLF